MPIHPPFNYVPWSRPKSHHAFPNHHQPTIMLHGMMDMLRSNAFSISNPTSWPTIWVESIYLCLVTENPRFQSSNGSILILWANLKRMRTCLQLKNGFLCCTCAPNPSSLKARLIVVSNNNLHVSDWSSFAITNAVPNQPSVTKVTQRLFSWSARSFGHPPLCLSISPLTSFLKCATEDWLMPTKVATLQVETPLLRSIKVWCFYSWDNGGIQLQIAPHILWN
jgi:hypothetical protein